MVVVKVRTTVVYLDNGTLCQQQHMPTCLGGGMSHCCTPSPPPLSSSPGHTLTLPSTPFNPCLPPQYTHLGSYAGTDVSVMTHWPSGCPDPGPAFEAAYRREYGFVLNRPVLVDDVRVRATGRAAELPVIKVWMLLNDTFAFEL